MSRVWILAVITLTACGQPEDPEPAAPMVGGKADWTTVFGDIPHRVLANSMLDFIYEADALPTHGASIARPWSAPVWATADDGIMEKWDGPESLSPAQKGDLLPQRMLLKGQYLEVESRKSYGVFAQSARPICTSDADCAPLADDSVCAKPRSLLPWDFVAKPGDTAPSRCIPTWWSLDYGWAAAAIAEPAPIAPVSVAGTVFYPVDLAGLLAFFYARTPNTQRVFYGEPGHLKVIPESGQPFTTVPEALSSTMNAGSFHILATNQLGLRRAAAVLLTVGDGRVTNRPLSDYAVTNADATTGKLKEISRGEAEQLLKSAATPPSFLSSAARFFHVELDYVTVEPSAAARGSLAESETTRAHHSVAYVLDVSAEGLIVDGHWIEGAAKALPSALWWTSTIYSRDKIGNADPFNPLGLNYETLQTVHLESAGVKTPEAGAPGIEDGYHATLAILSKYIPIGVPGGRTVTISTSGKGSLALYVGLGGKPSTTSYLCRSNAPGADQRCVFTAPASGASYTIRLKPREFASVDVKVSISAGAPRDVVLGAQ